MVQHDILQYEDYEIEQFTRGKNCELLSIILQKLRFSTAKIPNKRHNTCKDRRLNRKSKKTTINYNTAGHEQVMYTTAFLLRV